MNIGHAMILLFCLVVILHKITDRTGKASKKSTKKANRKPFWKRLFSRKAQRKQPKKEAVKQASLFDQKKRRFPRIELPSLSLNWLYKAVDRLKKPVVQHVSLPMFTNEQLETLIKLYHDAHRTEYSERGAELVATDFTRKNSSWWNRDEQVKELVLLLQKTAMQCTYSMVLLTNKRDGVVAAIMPTGESLWWVIAPVDAEVIRPVGKPSHKPASRYNDIPEEAPRDYSYDEVAPWEDPGDDPYEAPESPRLHNRFAHNGR